MSDACCAPGESAAAVADSHERLWQIRAVQASGAAGLALLAGLIAGTSDRPALETVAYAVALIIGGATFVPATLRALFERRVGVGTLMTIAAVGAVLLGELGEAASLAFLFSISEALEEYAITRTRRGLRALLALVPDRVTVLRGAEERAIDPAELQPGDVMIVRPGDRIATDGVVRAGRSTLDLSAITGESIPVECEPGRVVLAASVNGGGVLEIEVTAATADSSLARLVTIVEEAQERKGASQRLAERIARPLVPGVMVVAAGIAVAGSIAGSPSVWVHRALVVLVAAAPCAFAISVPVTVVAAIGAATRAGAIVKGGLALEALPRIRVIAFDKTGTLTRNRPVVVSVCSAEGVTRDDVLGVAAALEARSEHPLAGAILDAAAVVPPAADVQAIPGRGVHGRMQAHAVRIGKPGFVDDGPFRAEVDELQAAGATVVLVERDGRTIGAIAVRDELRPEAASAVEALHEMGMERIVMLTGDNRRTAEAVGRGAGVDQVAAELLPEAKVTAVQELQRRGAVAMVGDGINDAPALASADIGIAMGAAGTDAAIEAADVALLGEDLNHLPVLFTHAGRAGRIMRQNLAYSGAIILTLVPLAALGVLGLAAVVGAHELAEVFVIANGVRAGRHAVPVVAPRRPERISDVREALAAP